MAIQLSNSLLSEADIEKVFRPSASFTPKTRVSTKPLAVPFTIAVDTREQTPFTFEEINADSNRSYRPLVINTQRTTLQQGDYSIVGHEDAIAIERKSKQDLFGTLSAGRERFENELIRLVAGCRYAVVMVEAEWSEILHNPPEFSGLRPKTIARSVIAWQQRYPSIHWWMMPGRRVAELTTFRILERWWRENSCANKNLGDPDKSPRH